MYDLQNCVINCNLKKNSKILIELNGSLKTKNMKKIFLENGHEKVINCLRDLPPITTQLLLINLELTHYNNGCGIATLILSMGLVKSLPKIGMRKDVLLLYNICEDLRGIQNLSGIENYGKGDYLFLIRQKEMKEKLELINRVNSSLPKISRLGKYFIKMKIKIFYKKIFLLLYDYDSDYYLNDKRLEKIKYSLDFIYDIFYKDLKIPTEELEKAIIK